jgi:hypothetical protein
MSRLLPVLAGLAFWLCAFDARAETVRCESNGGSYRSCAVDTHGSVRLSRQLSSQGCWENDTWGYDRHKIWVNRGCRAEFNVGSGSSDNGKVVAAVALGVVAAAIIAGSHDDNDDDRRHDNRYDDRDGYRDDYRDDRDDVRYDDRRDRHDAYGDPRRTFRCESRGGAQTWCNTPANGHFEVFKQLSSSECRFGESWGVNGRRVWVNHGCRADFAIY